MGTENIRRAGWASKALDAFMAETNQRPHEKQEALGDLLCDLLHLAHTLNMDTDKLHASVLSGFAAELIDDE